MTEELRAALRLEHEKQREHRVVTPRSARVRSLGNLATAREVWVVLHGYGQLAADFLVPFGGIADDTRAIVAPEALNRFYSGKETGGGHPGRPVGATWMTREDRDAEIADYIGYLDRVVEQLADGRPIIALGFSQGVPTLLRWVTRGTTQASRVIAWAGELPGDVDLAATRHRFPPDGLDLVLGSRDEYLPWINLEAVRRRLDDSALPFRVHEFDGGHRLDRRTLATLADVR
ncbi:MAG: hypothetical protein IPF87_02575 [Gemmatimonadetes bacterium]|jgi:predicted esterase|nr:hypothetical protein [Gemmatimonadota bacterium]MBK8061247.1 hypothetical protein [Gemmatimonadota bacterium]MBK8647255.1 hypothetical protein [Gemmatimonadota bacterium]MBK9409212.1 hypothetical protein [Gemmatimonadota bacterium]MCC7323630.1 hypothetical protein [Gemmatimonadaceae bacterium]